MPSIQTVERLGFVKFADSELVKTWRDKERADAISAISLIRNPNYVVFGVRNSRDTLLGLIAVQVMDEAVVVKHMATRDTGKAIKAELINAVYDLAGDKRIKSPYKVPNWRKVGKEYWSR